MFSRADRVGTICEIKYTQSPVTRRVIAEMERKLEHFHLPARYTVHKVLVSATGCEATVKDAAYFDEIVDLERLVAPLGSGRTGRR